LRQRRLPRRGHAHARGQRLHLGREQQLTAVNETSNFASLVCAPDQPCDACLTEYPSDASAQCKAGHCEVVVVQLPGN
jgi:hypothetical protein